MKHFFQSISLLVLGAAMLVSCQPEVVQPGTSGNSAAQPTELQANNYVHPELFPMCGEADYVQLMSEDGSTTVNNCGFVPCTGNEPDWGVVSIRHGLDENENLAFAVNFQLAFGWMCVGIDMTHGSQGSVQLVNGIPVVDGEWYNQEINPVVNAYQLRRPGEMMAGCNEVALRLKVAKFNFFGGLDASTEQYLWIVNPQWNTDHSATSQFFTPYCVEDCQAASAGSPYPTDQCPSAPAFPATVCTQSTAGGNININSSQDVICVTGGSNIGNVNFNGAGTLVIDEGVTVSGGINANNGGTVIVRGTFNWNSSANINGNFKLFIGENGTLNRSGDLTMNNQNNSLVNLGTLNINNNLTYSGKVFNGGTLFAQGLNVNSQNSEWVNTGYAKFSGFANVNSGTRSDNCGTMDIQNNFQMNSQSIFHNYCTVLARGYAHSDGEFHNHAVMIAGLQGGGTGFNNQGNTYLYDGSSILTKNFYWSPNRPLTIDGDARVMICQTTLDSEGNPSDMSGNGQLRMNNGVKLHGAGTLTICDNNPNSSGDNPNGNWVTWPTSWENMVQTQGGASVVFRSLDPANDLPNPCN